MATPHDSSSKLVPGLVPSTAAPAVGGPPEGWVKPVKLGIRGRRPKDGLPLVASQLAEELRTNAAALLQELGPKAVDPVQLAAALDRAHACEVAEDKAATQHLYARFERGVAWDAALTLMAGLKLGVRYAMARDGTFGDRFPDLAKRFAPRKAPRKKTADAPTEPQAPAAKEPASK